MKNFLINKLPSEHVAPILGDILKYQRNTKLAVEVAKEVHKKVGLKELVDVFEDNNSFDAIYFFLGPLLDQTTDKKVYHKYLEACIKCS